MASAGGYDFALPDNVVLVIFARLDLESLLACSLVCPKWRRLSSYPALWKALAIKAFPFLRRDPSIKRGMPPTANTICSRSFSSSFSFFSFSFSSSCCRLWHRPLAAGRRPLSREIRSDNLCSGR